MRPIPHLAHLDMYAISNTKCHVSPPAGIFFDDLNDRPQEEIMAFSKDAVNSVVGAYVPLVRKHRDDAFTEQQRDWQQLRRGRSALTD